MNGLFEKDIRLLLQRKKLMIMYLAMAVLLSFTMDGTFLVSYMTLLGALLSTSTITYDEFDNGYTFLMTLPVDARTYAVEKHLFTGLSLILFWGFAVVLQILFNIIRQIPMNFTEDLSIYLTFVPIFLIMISILLPIELKYGAEKSRIVMIIFFGFILAAAFFGQKALASLGIDVDGLLLRLSHLSRMAIIAGILLITAVIAILSTLCSIHVMKHKAY